MVSRGSHKGLSRYAHEIKFMTQSTLCQGQTTSSVRSKAFAPDGVSARDRMNRTSRLRIVES